MATAAELLALVDTAIETRLAGGAVQAQSIAGRQIQYSSLGELRLLRNELAAEVNSGLSRRNYAGFARPS